MPVNVAWSVSADSFVNVLQRSNDGAPYQTMEYAARRFWPAGVKQSLRRPLTGVSYRYRIEPSDAAGNIGTAVAGPAWRSGSSRTATRRCSTRGGWALGSSPKAFDGSQRFTTPAGRPQRSSSPAAASRGSRPARWGVVTPACTSTASCWPRSAPPRNPPVGEIAFVHTWPASGDHTLKIVAVGDHRIDIDAIAVLS